MKQIEASQRGKHLHKISAEATRMIIERINLQEMGVRLTKLPLCSQEYAGYIEEFLPRAKNGFALALKSNQVTKLEIPNLLKLTSPTIVDNQWKTTALKETDNTLPEYHQVLATISELLRSGRVSFYGFEKVYSDVSYELGMMETYWCMNTDPEKIWGLMGEIENITNKALRQQDEIPTPTLLKAGHFFAVSQELSGGIFADII